jgi:hypothetical protein
MKFADTRVNQGGLMRCCTGTIANHVELHARDDVPEGVLVIDCEYETPGNSRIVLEGGVWRWNNPEELDRPPRR